MACGVRAEGPTPDCLFVLPFFLLITLTACTLYGQSSPTISVNVDLVVVHATIRNRAGMFVSGLQKEDFHVYENGEPQAIKFVSHGDVPVAVGLVVDNSGSMRRKRADVTRAALAFVRSSNPQDEIFVVNFNEHASLGLPTTELFSANVPQLERALNGVPALGETALYDGIEVGMAHLKQATRDKKVLIVISDGGDNASRHTLAQVLRNAETSNDIIYAIGLFDDYDTDRNPKVLRQIARATGGEAFMPSETGDVVKICERIAQDIRNQYTIGYEPTNPKLDGTFRKITVLVTGPHGEKLRVRARDGYLASPASE